MSLEYKDRGVLHKLTQHTKFKPQQSKRRLIRWTGKAMLAVETTALFAKDLAVNRFVGKETHIRFERRQNKNGKYRTHVKLVRADSPQELPRGIFHRIHKFGRYFEGDIPKPLQGKSGVKYRPKTIKGKIAYYGIGKPVKLTGKAVLAAETTAFFLKDLAANRLVGKEFHIRFERRQSKHGKYRTHIKLVRAEASDKPVGLLHKVFSIGRFFEGDVPFRKKVKLKKHRYKPKTLKGKAAYGLFRLTKGTAKFTLKRSAKLTKAALLTGESAVLTAGKASIDHFRRKLRDNESTHDSGRAVLASITALQTLNSGRKYLINYRRRRAVYQQKKASYKSQKQQFKSEKKKYKSTKKAVRLTKKDLKHKLKSIKKVSAYPAAVSKKSFKKAAVQRIRIQKRYLSAAISHRANKFLLKAENRRDKKIIRQSRQKQKKKLKAVKKSVKSRAKFRKEKIVQRINVRHKLHKRLPQNLIRDVKIRKQHIKNLHKAYKSELGTRRSMLKTIHKRVRIRITVQKKAKASAIKKQKLQIKKKRIVIKRRIRNQKKLKKSERKSYRIQKKQKKLAKKEMKKAKVVPMAALPLVPSAAMVKQLSSSYARKLVAADQNNDFMQAADKLYRIGRQTHNAAKKINSNLHKKMSAAKQSKLHSEKNKLHQKDKAKPKRKHKRKKTKKQKFSERVKAAAKKASKQAKKAIGNFAKFAIKLFAFFLAPIIGVIFILVVILMMFTGSSGNSSYILGTYNAQDRYLAWACEHYTKIAYDFNEKLLKLKTDDWKQGLEELGVNTSSYTEKPDKLVFGKSTEFNNTVSTYDYDDDRFASFLCAYYYEPTDNPEETEYWSWNSDEEVDALLQSLFDAEYAFKHKYEDFSGWKEYQKYDIYGGGGSSSSYYTIETEGLSKTQMKVKSVPPEIRAFCENGILHYDISTLEVLDANNEDKRTGYFIQDQRYAVVDPEHNKTNPFYTKMTVKHSEIEKYIDENGKIHFHQSGTETALTDPDTGKETGYFIVDVHSYPLTYYRYVWVHGKGADNNNLYEKRTNYSWADGTQVYYLVSPSDTKKWNSNLEKTCLISFYHKNYWEENCSLYYTVESKCSFDTAAETILRTLPDSEDKITFYHLLADGDENLSCPYGFHQCMSAPLGDRTLQKLIDNGKIYNRFGYNVKEWNKKDCVGIDNHKGLDILAKEGDKVYAIMGGYVEWVDESKNSMSVRNDSWSYWYDERDNDGRATAVKYNNIKTSLKAGDTVKSGDLIGIVTDKRECYDNRDSKAEKTYLHIEVTVQYEKAWWIWEKDNWSDINPLYLLYRGKGDENGEW